MEIIANEKPLVAAQSMKKIRHLLLYILYENASSKVPLNKEFALLQEYIDLEKLTAEKNITVNASINTSLLLKLLHHSFYCRLWKTLLNK